MGVQEPAPKESAVKPQAFTARELIDVWAARTMGGHLDELPRWLLAATRTGGVGPDQTASAMMAYVESVASFRKLRPALVWAFCRGKEPEEFRANRPGESYCAALLRMGLGEHASVPPRRLCSILLAAFLRDLKEQIREKPFVPPRPLTEEPDADAVAAQVSAEVDGALSRAHLIAQAARAKRQAHARRGATQ